MRSASTTWAQGGPKVTPETCGAIGKRDQEILVWVGAPDIKVVYCVVTEANPDIMLCHHNTYPSRHYAGCCLYLDGLEFYRIFLCNNITPFRTRRIYNVHV
jgi:hypothetical protein